MTYDPYAVTDRKRMTEKQRVELFVELEGMCCICGTRIRPPKESWIVEHVLPLWLGGTNDVSNLAPAHTGCAHRKTADEATERARGRSAAARHLGAKRSKMKHPYLKRTVDGRVVRRER